MEYEVSVAEARSGVIIVEAGSVAEARRKALVECDKYKGIPADCYVDNFVVDIIDCVVVQK